MQVFKLFLKIVKKNLFLVCIYLGVFAVVTTILIAGIKSSSENTNTTLNAYVEIEEENADVSTFMAFLEPKINKVELNNNSKVDDALFWEDIAIYIKIPKDFYAKVLRNEEALIIKSSPNSMDSYSLISEINQYFNQVKENIRLNLCSEQEALAFTKTKLDKAAEVDIQMTKESNFTGVSSMFNMGVYIICSLTLLIVGLVSFELRTTDISRRLNISPLSIGKRNILLTICYAFFSILFVGLVTIVGFIVFKEDMVPRVGYYIFNSCLFGLTMVCLALLLSSFFKSSIAFNCVNVIFPLATAFICGCFVDFSLMPEFTKVIAHIFPNYYIVIANSYIQSCSVFEWGEYFKIIWPCFLFIAGYIALTIGITKHLAKSEN